MFTPIIIKSLRTLKNSRPSTALSLNVHFTSISIRMLASTGLSLSNKPSQSIPKQDTIKEKFANMNLNPKTLKAIEEDFGYKEMSTVQHAVLKDINSHLDLLVRAKTGTGKTLAFMIAALETILQKQHICSKNNLPVLVLSPTRELAMQIAKEAVMLTKYHRLKVCTAVGGTPRSLSIDQLCNNQVDILIATPGRLNDLLSTVPVLRRKLSNLQVLVFDEADQLLEMGFQREVEDIVSKLPKERVTYMFSATLSPEIRQIASRTLRKFYSDIDTVPANEVDTHMKIKQTFAITPYKYHMSLLKQIIEKHKESTSNYKIIVFFPTTTLVSFISQIFNLLPDTEVMQIHSRLTQNQRVKVSQKFRAARSAILFTSDVSARGVDYPNVSLVIQVGLPSSRVQYIHRIGRTGRADKDGQAILILSPFEKKFVENLEGLPVREELRYNLKEENGMFSIIKKTVADISYADRLKIFVSYLGFQVGNCDNAKFRKDTAVASIGDFCKGYLAMNRMPPLGADMVRKLGLQNMNGIEIKQKDKGGFSKIQSPPKWNIR